MHFENRTLLIALAFTLSLAGTSILPAIASAYTVSGEIRYWDSRRHRSSTNGSRLTPSTDETNRIVEGLRVILYDQDGNCIDRNASCVESDDDYLGTDITDSNGEYSISGVGSGEDIYLTTWYSTGTGGSTSLVHNTLDSNGASYVRHSSTSWNISTDVIRDWNITCWWDGHNTTWGHCDDQQSVNDHFSDIEGPANILATLIDIDARFPDSALERNGHSGGFDAYFPGISSSSSECDNSFPDCESGRSCGFDDFCVGAEQNDGNHQVAHEVGHSIHRRALKEDGILGVCAGGWDWDSSEDEACATAEGWADFTAVATFFQNYASDPWVYQTQRNLEGDVPIRLGSSTIDECVEISNDPHRRPGNASRYFWDMFDWSTEDDDGNDDHSLSYNTLTQIWDDFPGSVAEGCTDSSCTDNHEEQEYDDGNDLDGRNVRDFEFHEDSFWEMWHNCVSGQDTG